MVSAGLSAVPGYADNVAARQEFEREHPDAQIWVKDGAWHGSMLVGGRRRQVFPRADLGDLLRLMGKLAAMAAGAREIEKQFPGWRVWLSDLDRWWAVRQGPDATYRWNCPMTLDADDAEGLLRQLIRYGGRDR